MLLQRLHVKLQLGQLLAQIIVQLPGYTAALFRLGVQELCS
jgi:hypothetical protein